MLITIGKHILKPKLTYHQCPSSNYFKYKGELSQAKETHFMHDHTTISATDGALRIENIDGISAKCFKPRTNSIHDRITRVIYSKF